MLEPQLSRLETSELVRRAFDAELAYLFSHTLIQDTVRASLLRADRKRLHRFVGEALEQMYPDNLTELSPLLVQHFSEAGDDAKTLDYAELSGARAAHLNANAEAITCYSRALELAQRTNTTAARLRDLFLKRGRVLEVKGDFRAALENYAELQRAGELRGDRTLELAAMMACATIHSIPSVVYDSERALALSDRALALARELDDQAAQATILWNLMLLHSRVGTGFHEGARYGQEALELARASGMREREAYILNDLSPLLVFQGEPERGMQYNRQARVMWRELDNLPMLSSNLGYAVMNHLILGEYDAAIAASNEALTISREIGNEWNEAFAQTWIGTAYLERGEVETAERVMRAAIDLGEHAFPPTLVLSRSDLARLYTDLGDAPRGIELAEQALASAEQRFPALRPWAVGALAHAYLVQGMDASARNLLQDAPDIGRSDVNPWYTIASAHAQIELAQKEQEYTRALGLADTLWQYLEQNRIRGYQPAVLIARARVYCDLKNFSAADADLSRAQAIAAALPAQWSLWQIFAARAKLESARQDVRSAENARANARRIIESIAARTPTEYRARFLAHAQERL